MPRLFFTIILGMMLFSCRAWAQEEDYIGTATSALQDVLSNLKQSVEKLSLDNNQLAARDNAMKEQVSQLQSQLEGLESQGDFLNKTAAQLQDKNPHRTQQIVHLEKENFDLDTHIQKTQDDITLTQKTLDAANREYNQAPSPESQDAERRQKEKLKLMKMIGDSQQQQETLHDAIQEFQKNTPLLPAANALAQQQFLKEQIKELDAQVAAYPPQKPVVNTGTETPNHWDDTQTRQLESELKDLEKNYSLLKDLTEQMTKKAQSSKISVSQHVEEGKLQGSIQDLNRQSVSLRSDLDDLRSQMIDLDKRKSRLEMMLH